MIATLTTISPTDRAPLAPSRIRAREAGFGRDVVAVAGRALRAVPRDLAAVIPPVFIALFFFVVNIGTLQKLTERNISGFDFKAFMMATAILLGVTVLLNGTARLLLRLVRAKVAAR